MLLTKLPQQPFLICTCLDLPTGEYICINGGMTKLMIYHDDHGWTYTSGQ